MNVVQDPMAALRLVAGGAEAEAEPLPEGRRAQSRVLRHRTYLRVALRIVTEEGLDALTMQRIAKEAGAAVGTVSTYFPSKAALVAEVQREAIETLGRSYVLLHDRLERSLEEAGELPADEVTLTRLLGFVRFWIAAFDEFPQEAGLNAMLLAQPSMMAMEDAARVLPAALRLLDAARACIVDCTEAGALSDGDAFDRVVTLASATTGTIQVRSLRDLDEHLFDGGRLAQQLALDLLRGWGAPEATLAAAHDNVEALAATGPLAPPVPSEDQR
jgi:AcrR family transcriptional regulator